MHYPRDKGSKAHSIEGRVRKRTTREMRAQRCTWVIKYTTRGMNVVYRNASMVLACEIWLVPIGVRWL